MNVHLAKSLIDAARAELAPFGLIPFGWFRVEDGRAALLIGNIGSSLWPAFCRSPEKRDGLPDGLDRWTSRVLSAVGNILSAEVRFPFGEKIWPFQNYAKDATGMRQSPLGLLIHPQYGLWCAFRGVLVFDGDLDFASTRVDWHPCDRCVEKPCLKTCPVEAFQPDEYDYMKCKAFVRSAEGQACRSDGCQARLACPVGQGFAYEADHQAFHMNAYV